MKLNEKQNLERVLESAVVVSWADLMRGAQTGLIHMEYGFAVAGTLDYVQVWSSITRGHWLLACNYWMSASTSHRAGIQFENGYESERLAHIMDSVMQHQTALLLPQDLGRKGLIHRGGTDCSCAGRHGSWWCTGRTDGSSRGYGDTGV